MVTTLPHGSGGQLRAEESTGLITVRVKSGSYSVVALIQVPDGYPIEGCGVELRSHNFPEHIARRHLVQVIAPRILVWFWLATVVVVVLVVVLHTAALLCRVEATAVYPNRALSARLLLYQYVRVLESCYWPGQRRVDIHDSLGWHTDGAQVHATRNSLKRSRNSKRQFTERLRPS